jgi:hypothetical protein
MKMFRRRKGAGAKIRQPGVEFRQREARVRGIRAGLCKNLSMIHYCRTEFAFE